MNCKTDEQLHEPAGQQLRCHLQGVSLAQLHREKMFELVIVAILV